MSLGLWNLDPWGHAHANATAEDSAADADTPDAAPSTGQSAPESPAESTSSTTSSGNYTDMIKRATDGPDPLVPEPGPGR